VTEIPYHIALIVGAGSGISASFARGLAAAGLRVGLAARNVEKLAPLAAEIGAETFAVDASDPTAVARLFVEADNRLGEPDVVHYNASARAHGPIAELDPMSVSYGTGTYNIENFEAAAKVILTNTVPVDAYRGYGRPEAAYIAERTIEGVARHLGLDPVAVRRINFVPRSDFPYRPYGSRSVIYDSGDYQGCLDKAVTAFDYAGRRDEQQRLRMAGRYRGIGVAAYTEMCGMAPSRRLAANGFDRGGWESARIAIDSSGRATLYSGSMSQGHGHATALAQLAADVLQMPVESIDVVQGDTKQVQAGHGTFNSRSMPVGGSARPRLCWTHRREGEEDRSANDGGRRRGHCV
jgi:CO/xanthine dehydrogenase Mo-binding subunit